MKSTEDIINGKLIRITKEAWELLKLEKKKQQKSIARITSDLIIKEYKK